MDEWLDGQKKGDVTSKYIFRRIHRRQEGATWGHNTTSDCQRSVVFITIFWVSCYVSLGSSPSSSGLLYYVPLIQTWWLSEDRIGSEGHTWGKCYVHLLVNRSTKNILCGLQVSSLAPWTKVPYFVSALGTLFTTHPPTPTSFKLRMSLDGLNLSLFFRTLEIPLLGNNSILQSSFN